MEEIINAIKNCKKCELWKTRTNPVPGEGSLDAKIMLIGEAPGYHEDKKGRPFVGQAGKYLDTLLESIGLKRSDVYIANVLKCRPPNNRDPKEEEIRACTPYLDEQIKIIKPKIIIALGRFSARYLIEKMGKKFSSISRDRGKIFEGEIGNIEVKVIPTYHPAAGLYNPQLKKFIEMDFQKVREEMGSKSGEKKRGNQTTLFDFLGK
ncbi:MAG: type-4 uracil-DNA glycosylase [Candidatus Njordarchaeia archaeon]